MMAEMQLSDASEFIADKGFITLSEPACGAGGMVLAAADVLAAQGHDVGQVLFVDATDISNTAFQMAYIQISLRGIAAEIHRGNTLSLEMFEHARTPAFFPFYAAHHEKFREWQEAATLPIMTAQAARPLPTPSEFKGQMNLFD
jgi:type I restriction-modification system DNA methylase subunit